MSEIMYEGYWNLSEKPFQVRRSGQNVFLCHSQQAAILRLKYCIENSCGPGLLLGPSGTGKSTILRCLASDNARFRPFVSVPYPSLKSSEMLRQIACELNPGESMNTTEFTGDDVMLRLIHQTVVKSSREGLHSVICFDDAHQLADATILNVVQPLLNLADSNPDLSLSLLLAGQPVLSGSIRRHVQINERIAVSAALQGFSFTETATYIEYCITSVGGRSGIFNPTAVRRLFDVTGGNPRRINRLCDMALLVGCAERAPEITVSIIDAISHELMPAAA